MNNSINRPFHLKVVLIDQLIEYFNLLTFPPQVAQRPRLPLRQLVAVLRRVVSALKQGQGGHLLQRSPGEQQDPLRRIFFSGLEVELARRKMKTWVVLRFGPYQTGRLIISAPIPDRDHF